MRKALDKYNEKYESSLWKKQGEMARKLGGHGGMDYLMCYRLVQCLREEVRRLVALGLWTGPGANGNDIADRPI